MALGRAVALVGLLGDLCKMKLSHVREDR